MQSAIERELKLDVGPRFRLPGLPGKPLPARTLVSVYHDTPDYQLARQGVTVRRRTEKRQASWQVKLPHGAARLELELASSATTVPEEVRRLLVAYARGVDLVPIATLRTRRSGVVVSGAEGPVAEVAVDRVSVLEGRRVTERFREVEVELLGRGTEEDLERIATGLRAAGAQDGDGRPKVFRALGLDLQPRVRAPGPSDPAPVHVQARLREQLEALRAHDPGTRLGTDPEELHQMRVAVRRARTILRVVRPMLDPGAVKPLREDLAWLGDVLGGVRDCDVMRQHLGAELARLPPADRSAGRRLVQLLDQRRIERQRALREALDDPRYFALLDRLAEFVERPPTTDADVSLRDLGAAEFRKLRKVGEALPDTPGDAEMHALRIKTKRARYAAELAAAVVGRRALRFAKQAKALQDALGEHQDAVVAESSLRELLEVAPGRRVAFVGGRMVERQHARRLHARETARDAWKKARDRGRKAWE